MMPRAAKAYPTTIRAHLTCPVVFTYLLFQIPFIIVTTVLGYFARFGLGPLCVFLCLLECPLLAESATTFASVMRT